jgi:hypothetical protein
LNRIPVLGNQRIKPIFRVTFEKFPSIFFVEPKCYKKLVLPPISFLISLPSFFSLLKKKKKNNQSTKTKKKVNKKYHICEKKGALASRYQGTRRAIL